MEGRDGTCNPLHLDTSRTCREIRDTHVWQAAKGHITWCDVQEEDPHHPYIFFSTASRKNLQMILVALEGFSFACFSLITFSSVS